MEEWRDLGNQIRNWGRWGNDDELGTLNLITAAKILEAVSLVKRGAQFSLGMPLELDGPQEHPARPNPVHLMSAIDRVPDPDAADDPANPVRFNDDYLIMPLQASTQWDAIGHIAYDGALYNGFEASLVTDRGASRLGIENPALRGGVVSRGVLIDLARHFDVDYLPPHSKVGVDDLDAALARQRVSVTEGDVVLFRTGWPRRLEHEGKAGWTSQAPGLDWRCAGWMHDLGVAAVAADNVSVETFVQDESGANLPMHMLTLRDMGLLLGEMWTFEELAEDCAADGVYEFLLVAAPLPFTGGLGSPVNPIALK